MLAAAVPNDQSREHPFVIPADVVLSNLHAAIPWLISIRALDKIIHPRTGLE
jgi:hypothetical protein